MIQNILEEHYLVLLIILVLVFIETGTVWGVIISGFSYFLFFAGFFAGVELLDLSITFILISVFITSVMADLYLFSRGRKDMDMELLQSKAHTRNIYARKAAFMRKFGRFAIMIGRFLPYYRSLLPYICGSKRIRYNEFYFMTLVSQALYFSLLVIPGYYFGKLMVVAWSSIVNMTIAGGLLFAFFGFAKVYYLIIVNKKRT